MEQRVNNINNSYVKDINVINNSTKNKVVIKQKYYSLLSIISIIISIIAICISCYRTNNLGFDYLGLLVGILALLVTIILGWNIYTAIHLNEIMDNKINEAKTEAIRRINISLATSQIRMINGYIANNDWYMVMHGYSTCIFDILQLQDRKMAEDIITIIDELLDRIIITNNREKKAFTELVKDIKKLSILDDKACDLYLKAKKREQIISR